MERNEIALAKEGNRIMMYIKHPQGEENIYNDIHRRDYENSDYFKEVFQERFDHFYKDAVIMVKKEKKAVVLLLNLLNPNKQERAYILEMEKHFGICITDHYDEFDDRTLFGTNHKIVESIHWYMTQRIDRL